MLIFGDLIGAGLEELPSDPTDPLTLFSGRIYRRTADGVIRMYNGASWKTIADTDTAQVVSKKVINESTTNDMNLLYPIAGSTSAEFQIPRMTTTERLAIVTPSISRIVYDTTLKSLFVYNGQTWTPAGGGSSLKATITQPGHGFNTADVGSVLYFDGTVYVKAKSDTSNTAEVAGVLESLIDLQTFNLAMAGDVTVIRTTGEGSLVPGQTYFLSATEAGRITANEPTVVGHVSKPVGIAKANNVLQFINMRGSVVGGANLRTQIPLANAATSTIQNVSAYEAGELTGWIDIQATTPLKFFISVKFSKDGAGTDYNVSYQASGNTPPVGFAISVTSAGIIQATLPSVTGFGSASFFYSLNAPAVGVTLPLSISATNVIGDTNPVGTLLDYAGTTAPSNYLMCDGRSLPTTGTFAALYAVIGYAYGGSGSSFNIPDFRGRFARYSDNMGTTAGAANRDVGARNADKSQSQATAKNGLSAATGSASNSSWTTGVLGSTASNNSTSWPGHGLVRGGNLSGNSADGSFPGQDHTHSTTITGDAETRPINLSCNKIIKY